MDFNWMPYLPLLKLLLTGTVVALVLYIAAGFVLKVLTRFSQHLPFISELLVQVKAPIRLLVPLMGLQTVWSSAAEDLLFIAAIRHMTSLAIIAAFTWLGLRVVQAIQHIILRRNPIEISDNLNARRIQTQTRVLVQTLGFFVLLFGAAAMLMTFPTARQFGTSLLASAGLAGLAVGFAAKPVLGNLIAGLQIAITQPIRLDDVVIVENEWGRVEEITGTYVVVRIWDDRRLIVPLQWFIENPFQNWTRKTSALIGSVFLWVDYSLPLEPIREEMDRLLKKVPELWDGRVSVLQVTEATESAIQLRILASSADSSKGWDLRCYLRENILNFINSHHPECLPKLRANLHEVDDTPPTTEKDIPPERQPPV